MLRRALPALLVSSALVIGCNLLSGVSTLEVEEADASALVNDGAPAPTTTQTVAPPPKDASSSSSSSSGSSSSSSGGPADAGPDTAVVIDAGPPRTSDDFNNHHYEIVFDTTTWTDARDKAAARGGYLATVTTAAENEFLRKLSVDSGAWTFDDPHGPWLGGYKVHPEGGLGAPDEGWRWVTEEPWSFTSWLAGEPNDTEGIEDVLGFYADPADGVWNDYENYGDGAVRAFIVEFDKAKL